MNQELIKSVIGKGSFTLQASTLIAIGYCVMQGTRWYDNMMERFDSSWTPKHQQMFIEQLRERNPEMDIPDSSDIVLFFENYE